jgi:SAM-dependent methyltransferase
MWRFDGAGQQRQTQMKVRKSQTTDAHAPELHSEREAQMRFYRETIDPEEEISRPRCYPRPVQYLLDFKIRTAWQLLDSNVSAARRGPEKILVVCCGSGMEAEMVAQMGQRVIALDLSLDAVCRARERARRCGLQFDLVVGDAENLPFAPGAVDYLFVHDGLHHLPDPYRGVREMLRVARRAVVIAEPADAALTRLSVKLGISGEYEEAGNYVYRLRPEKLVEVFHACGLRKWRFRRNLVYYQPWTFPIYRWFERPPLFWLFRAGFFLTNLVLGRWGNSLRVAAWKDDPGVHTGSP